MTTKFLQATDNKFKNPYIAKTPDANGYIAYTDEENSVWHDLIIRQLEIVKTRSCQEYLNGLEKLNLAKDHVPQCKEVSERLGQASGWSVTPVKALISTNEFFTLLANRQFPAASFIRYREEFDYLQEPDIFHEFFGHCPMLMDKVYADFMQKYGEFSLKASQEDRGMLARLYWFTVEFGLIRTDKGALCYGGGILSSKEETIYAVESPIPERRPWDPVAIFRTPYRIDIKQPIYYVLDSFNQLYQLLDNTDKLLNMIAEARRLGEFAPTFPPTDSVNHY